MSFYFDWMKARLNNEDDIEFKKAFLNSQKESIETLVSGDEQSILLAIELLVSIPINEFLYAIDNDVEFTSKDVFQYSNLVDATRTVCNILYYEYESLSYFEAGKRMTKAANEFACVKYGENHLKMAEMFSLVVFDKAQKPMRAHISNLGKASLDIGDDRFAELIRRLAIRNPFVRSMIYNAKDEKIEYKQHASLVLSGQTIVRRKHNVEVIVMKILEGSCLINNIRW